MKYTRDEVHHPFSLHPASYVYIYISISISTSCDFKYLRFRVPTCGITTPVSYMSFSLTIVWPRRPSRFLTSVKLMRYRFNIGFRPRCRMCRQVVNKLNETLIDLEIIEDRESGRDSRQETHLDNSTIFCRLSAKGKWEAGRREPTRLLHFPRAIGPDSLD